MSDLAVDYRDVGRAAREWDEHHVRLTAASEQVADAPLGGFTPHVAETASLFRERWGAHLLGVARGAETRADGLRDALREQIDSDTASWVGSRGLVGMLREVQEVR